MTAPRLLAAGATAALLPLLLIVLLVVTVLGAPEQADSATTQATYAVSAEAKADIPADYLAIYLKTGENSSLDWAILAAIGKIETDHGRLKAPGVTSGINTYGCCGGPMQFWIAPPHPNTWDSYGVDGNGDGKKNPYDPEDAIPAAANYLKASGAPGDWRKAIFAYNHATWYVNDVLQQAEKYRGTDTALTIEVPASSDRLGKLIAAANTVDNARIPYCYGGGHSTTPARPSRGTYCWHPDERKVYGSPDEGLDCSSAVSMILQAAGYKLPTMSSTELASWGEPGEGAEVTIYANATHAYLKIAGRYWGTTAENDRHGPGWHSPRTDAGFTARHPPGL